LSPAVPSDPFQVLAQHGAAPDAARAEVWLANVVSDVEQRSPPVSTQAVVAEVLTRLYGDGDGAHGGA
jgi:hypothetical protein